MTERAWRTDDPKSIVAHLLLREDRLGILYGGDNSLSESSRESPATAQEADLTDDSQLMTAVRARLWSIGFAIHNTTVSSRSSIAEAVSEFERWIREEEIVRVVGAGRALLAAAIPANRLCHAGARVFIQNDMVPLPNSAKGGAILAASASGRTPSVLQLLAKARELNANIRIVGIAHRDAEEFKSFCDVFIGIESDDNPYNNPLRVMGDVGEYIISEVLDAIVAASAKRAGKTEDDLRGGHEDLGPTGPYRPTEVWHRREMESGPASGGRK